MTQIDVMGEVQQELSLRPGRRTQAERRAETRGKIVQAAIDIINESGIPSASTILIAQRAGVSRGALQHHFSSKDDLMAEVVYTLTELVDEKGALDKVENKSLEERVDYAVDTYWAVYGNLIVLSALEVELSSRFDASLHARLAERFGSVGSLRDLEWVQLFSDIALPPQKSIVLRRMIIDTLRGIALRKLISGTGMVDGELDVLKRMVVHEMRTMYR